MLTQVILAIMFCLLQYQGQAQVQQPTQAAEGALSPPQPSQGINSVLQGISDALSKFNSTIAGLSDVLGDVRTEVQGLRMDTRANTANTNQLLHNHNITQNDGNYNDRAYNNDRLPKNNNNNNVSYNSHRSLLNEPQDISHDEGPHPP